MGDESEGSYFSLIDRVGLAILLTAMNIEWLISFKHIIQFCIMCYTYLYSVVGSWISSV
jgi:hypothetical protein